MADAVERLWAVVPAGGAGTRLWPLSRAASPKFLHDLTGSGRTLLQATVDRLLPLVGERVLVVTGAAHQAAVRRQLPDLSPAQVSPSRRPATRWPRSGWPRPPSSGRPGRDDRLVRGRPRDPRRGRVPGRGPGGGGGGRDRAAGHDRDRADRARDRLRLRAGGRRPAGFPCARAVREFVEKPDAERARAYLASGDYRWGAGMFVARATVLMDLLAEHRPPARRGAARDRDRPDVDRAAGGPRWRRSRSTTRSPSRPQRPVGWPRCPGASAGTTSVTSARSPTCCRPRPTACRCWAIRRRWWCRTAPGSS